MLLAAVLIVTSVPGMETTAFATQGATSSEVVSAVNYATEAGTTDGGNIGDDKNSEGEDESGSEVIDYTMDFLFTVKGTAQ